MNSVTFRTSLILKNYFLFDAKHKKIDPPLLFRSCVAYDVLSPTDYSIFREKNQVDFVVNNKDVLPGWKDKFVLPTTTDRKTIYEARNIDHKTKFQLDDELIPLVKSVAEKEAICLEQYFTYRLAWRACEPPIYSWLRLQTDPIYDTWFFTDPNPPHPTYYNINGRRPKDLTMKE